MRGLVAAAPFTFEHTTNADRSRAYDDFTISEFTFEMPIILSIEPSAVPVRRGECYVRITLFYGEYLIGVLSSAYITDSKTITWPPGVFEGFTEGPGNVRTIIGTNPAAGAEVTETVPTNAKWKLLAIRFAFTADANVADRTPSLAMDDGTSVFVRVETQTPVTAGQARTLNFMSGIDLDETGSNWAINIPERVELPQAYRIRTITTNIQVGDDYGAPIFTVEEWIEE